MVVRGVVEEPRVDARARRDHRVELQLVQGAGAGVGTQGQREIGRHLEEVLHAADAVEEFTKGRGGQRLGGVLPDPAPGALHPGERRIFALQRFDVGPRELHPGSQGEGANAGGGAFTRPAGRHPRLRPCTRRSGIRQGPAAWSSARSESTSTPAATSGATIRSAAT